MKRGARESQNPYKSVKQPKVAGSFPTKRRVPTHSADKSTSSARPVRFCFSLFDHEGPWPIHTENDEKLLELLKKLAEYEKLSWGEVEASACYKTYGDMAGCPNKLAVQRLVEEYEALDHIGRFRLSGCERLYGVREGSDFFILWWDPRHEIWPSEKKNT